MTTSLRRLPALFLGGAALVCASASCDGRAPRDAPAKAATEPPASFGGPAVIELDLRGGLGETSAGGLFGGGRRTTF